MLFAMAVGDVAALHNKLFLANVNTDRSNVDKKGCLGFFADEAPLF